MIPMAGKAAVGCIMTVLLAIPVFPGCDRDMPHSNRNSGYKVVMMESGQVFFGKIEKDEGRYMVLKDAYFIPRVSGRDSGKIEVRRVVIGHKDSRSFRSDVLYIDPKQVMLLESLSPESRIAKLIREAETEKGG